MKAPVTAAHRRVPVIGRPVTCAVACALLAMGAGRARADADRPVVHPIYAHVPDAPQNDLAQKRFETAIRRIGLGALEIIDIEADPPPTAAEKLKVGIEATRKLDFAGALAALDGAANEVAARGGAGLDATALSDLFLYRGWATARADFNPAHVPEVAARTQAYADIARAAMVSPGRELNAQQFPPAMVEDWTRARADVRERAQGTLIVRAAPEALVSCDGGARRPSSACRSAITSSTSTRPAGRPGARRSRWPSRRSRSRCPRAAR